MVPIPQYPLYSASLNLLGAKLLPYHLNEEKQWGIDVNIKYVNLTLAFNSRECL